RQHPCLPARRGAAAGAGGRGGRALRWRRRPGAGLSPAAGPDRRALHAGPVRQRARRTPVPPRRSRPLPAGRAHPVPGPRRRPGQDPRLPHRAGGDRGGLGAAPGGGRGGGGGDPRGHRGQLHGAGTAASSSIAAAAGAGATPGAEALRAFLRERLPEPMVPAAFVWLAALPLTPNGKLDRRALPAPQWERGEQEGLAPPRNPAGGLLLGLWREVLGVERIGIHDSFFALGGPSLQAARLVSGVRRSSAVELPLAALFEAPKV